MFDVKKLINDVMEQVNKYIPQDMSQLPQDIQKNIRDALQAALGKMDLVTREEFDAQTKVLARTREKLEKLEQHLEELEKKRR
jgi:BMFP domain-containing protein YqiC